MASGELPPYDPQWLQIEEVMGGRQTLYAEPVDESRTKFAGMYAAIAPMIPPPTGAVKEEDVQISPDQRVRIFTPAASSGSGGEKLPVGLYIHSGGWYGGSVENETFLCRAIVEKANIILFSPDYRLAPENPYPAGLEDCIKAYDFMHLTASKYGGDNTKKFIMGGSAGGNLSACVAVNFAADKEKRPTGLLVACLASCEPSVLPEKYKARYTPELYNDTPMIGTEIVAQARAWLAVPDPADPLFSPLLHPDLRFLPQVHVAACTQDPTYQESIFFYEECKEKCASVDLVEWKGWPHFFWMLPMLPKSAEFMDVWCERIRSMIRNA